MNDAQIRKNFHQKRLRRHHATRSTLVVDELGLKHGKCRADIAVINGHLIGYEIKSDDDSLDRLNGQIQIYGAVFDRASLVVGERHLKDAQRIVPKWWGVLAAREGQRGAVHFETVRKAGMNPSVDDFSVAQLLWRSEAVELLAKLDVSRRLLRRPRTVLYRELVRILKPRELRSAVRECLKDRRNWRCLLPPSQDDD